MLQVSSKDACDKTFGKLLSIPYETFGTIYDHLEDDSCQAMYFRNIFALAKQAQDYECEGWHSGHYICDELCGFQVQCFKELCGWMRAQSWPNVFDMNANPIMY